VIFVNNAFLFTVKVRPGIARPGPGGTVPPATRHGFTRSDLAHALFCIQSYILVDIRGF
jgi:hypothetical protein